MSDQHRYQIVVSFEAGSDDEAIEVMEYMDGDLPNAGLAAGQFSTSMPKRHVPAKWEAVRYPSELCNCGATSDDHGVLCPLGPVPGADDDE